MQTGRAIIIGAAIIAAAGGVTAWMVQPRYSLANPGQGVTVRLDRRTGDLMGCQQLECRLVVKGGQPIAAPEIPPPPPGYAIDNQQ